MEWCFLCITAACTHIVTLWNSMVKHFFKIFLGQLPAVGNSLLCLFVDVLLHIFEYAAAVIYGGSLFLYHDVHGLQHGVKAVSGEIAGYLLAVLYGHRRLRIIRIGITKNLKLAIGDGGFRFPAGRFLFSRFPDVFFFLFNFFFFFIYI